MVETVGITSAVRSFVSGSPSVTMSAERTGAGARGRPAQIVGQRAGISTLRLMELMA